MSGASKSPLRTQKCIVSSSSSSGIRLKWLVGLEGYFVASQVDLAVPTVGRKAFTALFETGRAGATLTDISKAY